MRELKDLNMKRFLQKGFTLIEMLLVMVIASMILYMSLNYITQRTQSMSIDRTAAQMQQILNAGLSYYVKFGTWPTTGPISTLQAAGYLPAGTFVSPIGGQPYTISSSQALFSVSVTLPASSNATAVAQIIAGKLPLATVSGNTITASVNIPGQNLNNASAMNFAGVYHHGGCIPVPTCPVDKDGQTMQPQVFVVPVSISGVNDEGASNSYPLNSFTAYAKGGTDTSPAYCDGSDHTQTGSRDCTIGTTGGGYGGDPVVNWSNGPAVSKYWRACAQIITQKGDVSSTRNDDWGNLVTLAAFTRCAINNEPAGSNFNMYSN